MTENWELPQFQLCWLSWYPRLSLWPPVPLIGDKVGLVTRLAVMKICYVSQIYTNIKDTTYNLLTPLEKRDPPQRSLQWRHNERDGISNHQRLDCLLNRLFRRTLKKTSKLCVTGLCEGNSPVAGEFPAQRASNAENVPILWRLPVRTSVVHSQYDLSHYIHWQKSSIVWMLNSTMRWEGCALFWLVQFQNSRITNNLTIWKHIMDTKIQKRLQSSIGIKAVNSFMPEK